MRMCVPCRYKVYFGALVSLSDRRTGASSDYTYAVKWPACSMDLLRVPAKLYVLHGTAIIPFPCGITPALMAIGMPPALSCNTHTRTHEYINPHSYNLLTTGTHYARA